MSWAKESAKVGLSGLTPLEAAREAMFLRCFQDMPDPLKQEVEITSPDDIPMVSINKQPQESASWYELGKVAGVEVVEDADVEEELMTEEDREVEKVMTTNRQKYDKLLKAIRTVKAGHQMVAEGERMVAQGWELYEEVVGEAGAEDLPQLLRSMWSSLTPTQMKQELKREEGEGKGEQGEGAVSFTVGKGGSELPVTIQVKNEEGRVISYNYGCPQCDMVKGTRRGMDSHIQQVHTLRAFVCCYCEFSTYNMDSLQRHEKKVHNK